MQTAVIVLVYLFLHKLPQSLSRYSVATRLDSSRLFMALVLAFVALLVPVSSRVAVCFISPVLSLSGSVSVFFSVSLSLFEVSVTRLIRKRGGGVLCSAVSSRIPLSISLFLSWSPFCLFSLQVSCYLFRS